MHPALDTRASGTYHCSMRRSAAVLVALALLAPAAQGGNPLRHLAIVGSPHPAVRIELSSPSQPAWGILPAADGLPDRVYVDLPGTDLAGAPRELSTAVAPLARVRTGQFDPQTVRIVIDLRHPSPVEVRAQGRIVTIALSPREATPEPVPNALPVRTVLPVVVIDPGHGGKDPGATGVNGVREKDVVLEVARELAQKLSKRLPVIVKLTRADDSYLSLDERIGLAPPGTALFLSLHANACGNPDARGVEVFYGDGAPARAALLGHRMMTALRIGVGEVRGHARPARFRVLVDNPTPSALIEIGYLTHTGDAERSLDPAFRTRLTDALIDGVATFLGLDRDRGYRVAAARRLGTGS